MNEITAITPQVKDKKRCNIYVDGAFCCGLTLEAMVKNRLKVGRIVTQEQLAEIQLESERQTAFDKALIHLSATRKTERQIRTFLAGKGYLSAVADYVVEKLISYGFLNDAEYAEAYAQDAARKKGGRLIRMELKNKGISDAHMDGALDGISSEQETETAKAILHKYMRGKTADVPTLQKAFRYLMGKGFDYEIIKSALSGFGMEDD